MSIADQDMTPPDWLRDSSPDDEGTAIYFLDDPKAAAGGHEQLLAPNVTHRRCRDLAGQLDGPNARWRLHGYRWVPNSKRGLLDMFAEGCGGRCRTNADCANPLCRCILGWCRSK